MKPIRFALTVLAVCVALPASAGVTTTTYNFSGNATGASNTSTASGNGYNNTTTTSTGATTFQNNNVGQYGNGGTNYGNTITWGGASGVTVSAWSTTATGNKFETAFIGNYGGDLGVTSQPGGFGTNTELNGTNQPNTSNNQHAVDNVGAYDALVFSFSSAVTLSDVSLGFPSASSGLDSDSTILYYKGTGTPSSTLSARTVADLVSSGDWGIATNIGNMAQGSNATGLSTSISSKYWLVGAYMGIGGNSIGGAVDTGNDFFKVNGLTVKASTVPEPSSIALLGLAGAGLLLSRRKVRKG